MPIITLTTDFGVAGPYVAAMKGVILAIDPDVRLVDISHSISPQNVRQAAMVLAGAAPWFPPGTIHLAVVDPGVGADRRIVYAEIGTQRFVCPDNGLLSRATRATRPARINTITNPEYWLPNVSATFHGRDIMAPVAAALSRGVDPDRLGPRQSELFERALDWPAMAIDPDQIVGSVIWIDDFGNLITDISASMLVGMSGEQQQLTVEILGHTIRGVSRTYGDHPDGTLIALIGSGGQLEIAVAASSAAKSLSATVGTRVTVRATS